MNPLSQCDAPADNATRTTQKQSRKKTYENLVWSKGYVKGRSHIRCVARCCVILVKTLLVFLLAQRSNAQRMCEAAFNVYEKGKEKETAFNLIHCFDLCRYFKLISLRNLQIDLILSANTNPAFQKLVNYSMLHSLSHLQIENPPVDCFSWRLGGLMPSAHLT